MPIYEVSLNMVVVIKATTVEEAREKFMDHVLGEFGEDTKIFDVREVKR